MVKNETKKKPEQKKKKQRNGQFSVALSQFRRNKLAMVGICVFLFMVIICIFAEQLTPYDYAKQDLLHKFAPLSLEHPLGTDNLGRDILTRLLKGGQISLLIGLCAALLSAAMGAVLGCTAAYFGGIYETVVMRCMDILMSMPALLLATAISTALGIGLGKSIIAIAMASLANITRMMYSTALTVKNQEYLEAANATGASKLRCIFRHVLPNCLAPLIILTSNRFGTAISQIASLSFLGLGVQPPTPEWGSILNAGKQYVRTYWPLVVFPGAFIALTLVCVNFIGDGLRDALDPRLKR